MKKATKITLWVLGSLAILVIATFMSADIIASYLVKKQVAKALERMPEVDARVEGIYLNLISGSAIVKDITFCTNSLTLEDTITGERAPGLALHIPTIAVWNIRYWKLFREHRLVIPRIDIDNPQLLIYLDEQHPESIIPMLPKDTTLAKANNWLRTVEVRHINIDAVCAHMRSISTPLYVAADSLSFETQDLAYNFSDSVFSYNDSVYALLLRTLKVETPDGNFAIETHNLQTANQGAISLGYTRLRNISTPKQMADMAKEPTSWIGIELNHCSTSALNPLRKALAQDYTLDSINVDIKRLHVCRDERYKPKVPFVTPQDFLRQVPVQFFVKHVSALARKVDIEFTLTDINCGQLHLKDIHTTLANITNHPGASWFANAHAPFGENGKIDAAYTMHINKASSFEVKLDAREVETADLDPFIRPLIGITSQCHINHLDAHYKGDKESAAGEFCMQYHGLNVLVHKEDKIPYEIVTKHANTFTQLANTLVPKSNPTSVDPAPRRYAVEWKRDEWKPYPLYLFGPCIDGVKKTMLPGLYVHKQIANK